MRYQTKELKLTFSAAWRSELRNALLWLPGSVAMALGIALFLLPNQIASGGTPGMAILLNHLSGFSVGTMMLAINIPLLIVGCCFLGQGFVWRTVIVVSLVSGSVDLLHYLLPVGVMTFGPLSPAVLGGSVIGLGVGLVLKGDASAGGPTIVAKLITSRTRFRPGRVIMAMDIVIVSSSGLVFGAVEPAFYSLVSVVVTGRTIDLVGRGDWAARIESVSYFISRFSIVQRGTPQSKTESPCSNP